MTAEDYKTEMEAFIEHSLSALGWHTHAQHEKAIQHWTDKLNIPGLALRGKVAIKVLLVTAIKDELAKLRKIFANEFKFNRKALVVKGVKYERETNRFYALLVWTEPVQFEGSEMETVSISEVRKASKIVFPSWIVIDLLPNNFDW